MPKSHRNSPETVFFKLLRSLGIDSKESIPPAYATLAGRYDSLIPTRFLAPPPPIDCSKIPALSSIPAYSNTVESDVRQMKQCWMTYIKRKKKKFPP